MGTTCHVFLVWEQIWPCTLIYRDTANAACYGCLYCQLQGNNLNDRSCFLMLFCNESRYSLSITVPWENQDRWKNRTCPYLCLLQGNNLDHGNYFVMIFFDGNRYGLFITASWKTSIIGTATACPPLCQFISKSLDHRNSFIILIWNRNRYGLELYHGKGRVVGTVITCLYLWQLEDHGN